MTGRTSLQPSLKKIGTRQSPYRNNSYFQGTPFKDKRLRVTRTRRYDRFSGITTPDISGSLTGDSNDVSRNTSRDLPTISSMSNKGRVLSISGAISRRYRNAVSPDAIIQSQSGFRTKLSELPDLCHESLESRYKAKSKIYKNWNKANKNSFSAKKLKPEVAFSKACLSRKIPPVPVLSHITDNKLVLNRYNLNPRLVSALGETIEFMEDVWFIHLDENGIKDLGGSELVSGIRKHQRINSFYYTNNEIGPLFTEEFRRLLKTKRNVLYEINFRGCRAAANSFQSLCGMICQYGKIRRVWLADIGLDQAIIRIMSSSINMSSLLQLDLSNNAIPARATRNLFASLRHNKQLRFLNYSRNPLPYKSCKLSRAVAKYLRNSPSLMHIDLSFCGMNDRDARVVVRAAGISLALIGMHLSGNNFSRGVMAELSKHMEFEVKISWVANSADSVEPPLLSQEKYEIDDDRSKKIDHMYNMKHYDNTGKRQVFHKDSLINIQSSNSMSLHCTDTDLIFSRVLGRHEVSNNWTVSQHCWICEKWDFCEISALKEDLQQVESENVTKAQLKEDEFGIRASFADWQFIKFDNQGRLWETLLVPPGKHQYWFWGEDEIYINPEHDNETIPGTQYLVNTIEIPLRAEDPPLWGYQKETAERVFVKKESVFADWSEDDYPKIERMLGADNRFSKLSKKVKQTHLYVDLWDSLVQYYAVVHEIFLYSVAMSNHFPSIGWMDFDEMCKRVKIIDKQHLNVATIDTIFKAVNFEVVDLEANDDRDLCRYEFFEIIVRMAMEKYIKHNLTPRQAFEKIMKEHFMPNALTADAHQYRWNAIYTVAVNDIMHHNDKNVKALFASLKTSAGARVVNLDKLVEYTKSVHAQFDEREFMKAYLFSKQSIIDEMDNNDQYTKMPIVEFNEFLCRYADVFVKDEIPLPMKIPKLLDAMFRPKGLIRVEVPDMDSDVSDGFY